MNERPDLARPKESIDVTGLFQTLVGRAERQASLEQRRLLAIERGDTLPGDIASEYEEVSDLFPESAFDETGQVGFLRAAKTHSVVYDSKEHNPGIGYPSCSRALSRMIKVYRDPNGYYAYIGVLPDASFGQIKKALRKLYQKFHPDGWAPDPAEFDYLREIAAVLTDPRRRLLYDNLSHGEKWLDSRVKQDLGMVDDAIDLGAYIKEADESAWSTLRRTEGGPPREEIIRPETGKVTPAGVSNDRAEAMRQASEDNGYDFFAEPLSPGDFPRAQLWYHYLVRMAPLGRYTRPMRVWLYNEREPYWSDIGGILKIPRHWPPCDATAFALYMCVINDTPGENAANVAPVG